jgi:hypothetical protein
MTEPAPEPLSRAGRVFLAGYVLAAVLALLGVAALDSGPSAEPPREGTATAP